MLGKIFEKISTLIEGIKFRHVMLIILFSSVLFFTFFHTARASIIETIFGSESWESFISTAIAQLMLLVVNLLGSIFVMLVGVLIDIAKFNHFIDLEIVIAGWGLVRDLANMFFIVVLLIIAFSTILKIQSYHYQKTFMKLVIMAVLINFSKLIAGFLIDFFQVIMLTFVNGFKDVLAGNFAKGFGLYEMLSLSDQSIAAGGSGGGASLAIAAIIAVILVLVADMTVLIMAAVLLWRIAMLWVLVIISPLAYLAYAGMPKYWSQWWSEFFKHLVSGPVIAFFLWLALLSIQTVDIGKEFAATDPKEGKKVQNIFSTKIDNKLLINYMVMLALLMGGLAVAQKMASQAGGAVGAFASKVQKYGTRAGMIMTGAAAARWGLKRAKEGAKEGAKGLATTRPVRDMLGWVGSRRGVFGGILGATGVRKLATVGLAKAEVEKKAREEKQRNFYGQIQDTRVRRRVVNSRFNTAARRVVRDSSPSLINDNNITQQVVNDLSQDKINRLSDAELTSLGQRAGRGDIDVRGTRLGNHLARNANDRSLHNFGVEQAQVEEAMRNNPGLDEATARQNVRGENIGRLQSGLDIPGMVVGQDRNGRDLNINNFDDADDFYRGGYGPSRVVNYDYDRLLRRNQFDNMYRLADTEDVKKGRGAGNTSINRFSQGGSNALAVDFDKLDKEKVDFLKNFDEAAKVKGVNLATPEKITQAAEQLAKILDNEVKKLRSSGGDANQINNLEQARERLQRPEELADLQVFNSSAHGYGLNDLKKTVVHEKVHGLGVKSEKETEDLTQQIIDNRLYPVLEKLAAGVARGKSVAGVVAAQSAVEPEKMEVEPSVEAEEVVKREGEEPTRPVPEAKAKPGKDKKVAGPEVKPTSAITTKGISNEALLLRQIRNLLRKKK